MKQVLFKKRINLRKRIKTFSIYSRTEDHECKTRVRKGFAYGADWARDDQVDVRAPLIFIRKSFNTKTLIETFSFHVKGYFYVKYNEELIRVRFHHTLDIEIQWKSKKFSPKKSVSLT